MKGVANLPARRLMAFLLVVFIFLLIVDAATIQLQMYLMGGKVLVGNVVLKVAVVLLAAFGFLLYPKVRFAGLPVIAWLVCVAYLLLDMRHLLSAHDMTLVDVLQSYNAYYALLLIGPFLIAFRGGVSERAIIRLTVFLFVICAVIGWAQYLTVKPLLFTESADGSFAINSWDFFEQVRAFSLFTSSMNFGLFCSLAGALGVALCRTMPKRGALLFVASALACFCTLTRLSYLVFACSCGYAWVLTFGKKPKRGLWYPPIFFFLGVTTIVVGLSTFTAASGNLQDTGSLIQRIGQWGFYSELIVQSSTTDKLFGLGIVQNEKLSSDYPMLIDSSPLALVLHIGIVGLVLFGVLLVKMWLYLRREAVATGRPFVIAAASFCASFACAGIFNIVFMEVGAVFALAVLCGGDRPLKRLHQGIARRDNRLRKRPLSELVGSLKET
ncbi:MAG TPA: hypothetical protein VGG14_18205 [Candidatus Sulfotelmatobacter sp.]|jgi:hypothetical protein